MLRVKNLEIEKAVFTGAQFPCGWVHGKNNYKDGDPVRGVVVFPGIGEVAKDCSISSCMNRGFFYAGPDEYSLLASAAVFPFVFFFVQTYSGDTRYQKGEIDFIVETARKNFNIVEMEAVGISLGGYGLLDGINTEERGNYFKHILFDMPGGNGNAGKNYPDIAVKCGIQNLFVHAQDDTLAKPFQSTKINSEIKAKGGDSQLVLYRSGAHGVMTRPFGAWYDIEIERKGGVLKPWRMAYTEAGSSYAVVPGSDVPDQSMYAWFMNTVPDVQKDKLLLTQEIWQTPDGDIYTKNL